ncbi:hypothetical protein BDZ85DRAFT_83559 [Elsinoe ampelina]|uniref:RBR-type E3 ubiquitin transferase n=1 Tax=Elsinoe ampelina TaxID=302913 RepID=A0A6A6GGA2_9PEZI|nr:hypothetical protein BDZ85DRAFT_83559 [Elsinoe ampelina]
MAALAPPLPRNAELDFLHLQLNIFRQQDHHDPDPDARFARHLFIQDIVTRIRELVQENARHEVQPQAPDRPVALPRQPAPEPAAAPTRSRPQRRRTQADLVAPNPPADDGQPGPSNPRRSKRTSLPAEKKPCVSCSDEYSTNELAHLACDHDYCGECLSTMFQNAMKDESAFPPRCCQPITLEHAMGVLPFAVYQQYSAKLPELETKDKTYCHVNTCTAWIAPRFIVNGIGRCSTCSAQTCVTCKGENHNGDCPADEATQAVLEMAAGQNWRRCSRCRTMVELNTGCNHITCRCGFHFCYTCGVEWKTCRCPVWNERNILYAHPPGVPNVQHQQQLDRQRQHQMALLRMHQQRQQLQALQAQMRARRLAEQVEEAGARRRAGDADDDEDGLDALNERLDDLLDVFGHGALRPRREAAAAGPIDAPAAANPGYLPAARPDRARELRNQDRNRAAALEARQNGNQMAPALPGNAAAVPAAPIPRPPRDLDQARALRMAFAPGPHYAHFVPRHRLAPRAPIQVAAPRDVLQPPAQNARDNLLDPWLPADAAGAHRRQVAGLRLPRELPQLLANPLLGRPQGPPARPVPLRAPNRPQVFHAIPQIVVPRAPQALLDEYGPPRDVPPADLPNNNVPVVAEDAQAGAAQANIEIIDLVTDDEERMEVDRNELLFPVRGVIDLTDDLTPPLGPRSPDDGGNQGREARRAALREDAGMTYRTESRRRRRFTVGLDFDDAEEAMLLPPSRRRRVEHADQAPPRRRADRDMRQARVGRAVA